MRNRFRFAAWVCCLLVWTAPMVTRAQLLSYPTSAIDTSGVTGATLVSLGVPDYQFINDSGLGFGGTNTDAFDVGEAVEFGFPVPLRNIPGQHDLVLSAFVGGLGATDNANVQIEVSSDGTNFVVVDTFNTQEARNRDRDRPENNFEGVKPFFIDFAAEDQVTRVRLTNLAGTLEGLRLDAIEGLHPVVGSDHAFEVRLDRYNQDFFGRFLVRIKNLSDLGGIPIREFRMTRSPAPGATLEDTFSKLVVAFNFGLGSAGEAFICVENCIDDNGPLIPFSRHAWSVDGLVEAPPGIGLDPGRQAGNDRTNDFDTDNTDYLTGMTFRVTFTDGFVQDFSYDDDVIQVLGSLYQKYQYFAVSPGLTGPRPTDYFQFVEATPSPVPTLSAPSYWLLSGLFAVIGILLIRVRSRST